MDIIKTIKRFEILIFFLIALFCSNVYSETIPMEYINSEMENLYIQTIQLTDEQKYQEAYKKAKEFMDKYVDSSLTYGFITYFNYLYFAEKISNIYKDYPDIDWEVRQIKFKEIKNNLIKKENKKAYELLICVYVSDNALIGFDPKYLKEIIEKYPNSKYAIFAEYILLSEFGSALEKREDFIRQHKHSRLIPSMHYRIASFYEWHKNKNKAKEKYKEILTKFKSNYYILSHCIESLFYLGDEIDTETLNNAKKIMNYYLSDKRKRNLKIDLQKVKKNLMKNHDKIINGFKQQEKIDKEKKKLKK